MRKQGAKIKHSLALKPLGIKGTQYERDVRVAILAIEKGVCNEQHIVDIWTMADMAERLNKGRLKYISTHCQSIKRLADAIHNGTCDGLGAISIVASSNILLDWIHSQPNKKVCDIAIQQIKALG